MADTETDATHAIIARIDARLSATGKTDRAASIDATGQPHTIRNIRKGSKPAVDVFEGLAKALDTTPGYLAFGTEERPGPAVSFPAMASVASLPIIGQVAAGRWLTVDTEVDAPLYDNVPVPPDPRWPFDWQFAVEVFGTSVNRVAPNGAILSCVDTRKARLRPREGELVVVEQSRDHGSEIMRTAKRYHEVDGTFELRPDSDDPKWVTPIVIDPNDGEDEGVSIKVIGIVTWVHSPVNRIGGNR